MAKKEWFSTHGQIVQTVATVASCLLGWIIAYPQLKLHADILSAWPMLVVPLAVFSAFQAGRHFNRAPSQERSPNTPIAEQRPQLTVLDPEPDERGKRLVQNPPTFLFDNVYVQAVRIKSGSYWDDNDGRFRLRVRFHSFAKKSDGQMVADLEIDTAGSLIYGGTLTKSLETNRYLVPPSSNGFQAERSSLYNFSFSDEHIHFLTIRLDSYDLSSQEAVLAVAKVRTSKRATSEWK
jgi:hypothetical protein